MDQSFESRYVRANLSATPAPRREFAVAADGDIRTLGEVPQIPERRRGEIAVLIAEGEAAFTQVRRAAAAVIGRPQFFDDIRRVSAHREGMAVVADLRVHVEIVELRELTNQRVGVGRDVFPEQRQRRIAIAARDIAEHLIVGSVFPDDVKHVLDRRRSADSPRDRTGDWSARWRQPGCILVRRELDDPPCHGRQRRLVRHFDNRQRAGEDVARVAPVQSHAAGLRPPGIRFAGQPLAVQHVETRSVGREHD